MRAVSDGEQGGYILVTHNPHNKERSFEQRTASALCCDLDERIVGITGAAGTGKTTVLGDAYAELAPRHTVTLAAPTGRAAKRITELTGIPSKTVHRLLEFPTPEEIRDANTREITLVPGEPKRNAFNPLAERVVIVDEASMLSQTLYEQLMDACRGRTVVRFFGDNNQLAPVERSAGQLPPFFAILDRFSSVTLTYNYRSEDEIVSNAERILNGNVPVRNSRFEIIYNEQPIQFLLNFVTQEFAQENNQVIIPTRKNKAGTMLVNVSLQTRLNRQGKFLRLDRHDEKEAPLLVRPNDKFLWTKNDYQLNLFNGEIGVIEDLDTESGELAIATPDRQLKVPPAIRTYSPFHGSFIQYDPRRQIDLGYAVTTHKAQGSEFDTVIYCITTRGHYPLLDRRNFYTAVTRARQRVIVITDRSAMRLALRKASLT